jgi:hypothetical protein
MPSLAPWLRAYTLLQYKPALAAAAAAKKKNQQERQPF